MDNQEALDNIISLIAEWEAEGIVDPVIIESVKIAKESLKKDIPQKTYRNPDSKSILPVQCPICACHVGDDDFVSNYCSECGQKLKR